MYSEQNKLNISSMIWEGSKVFIMIEKNVRNEVKKETKLNLSRTEAKSEVPMHRNNRITVGYLNSFIAKG